MVANEIVDYFNVSMEKIHIIYNAVDLQKFDLKSNYQVRLNLRNQLGLDQNHTVFLFVGSGFERKGLSVLLDCMAALPKDCILLVVGKDDPARKYEWKSRKLGIEQRVIFFGMQKDVIPFFAAADAFVLPTLYDAFANVVLEAMASSLPVITSFKCGAVDLIENGKNGFVCDSLDKAAIIQNMLRLRDPRTRISVGQSGRETVEKFTTANMSHQLHSLYKKILNQ